MGILVLTWILIVYDGSGYRSIAIVPGSYATLEECRRAASYTGKLNSTCVPEQDEKE